MTDNLTIVESNQEVVVEGDNDLVVIEDGTTSIVEVQVVDTQIVIADLDDDRAITQADDEIVVEERVVEIEVSQGGPQGAAGLPGTDGATWFNGAVDPPAALGSDNDYYLNNTSKAYFQKQSGVWIQLGILSGDKSYEHTQASASSLWSVNHNMGRQPSVQVEDSAGTTLIGHIEHIDANNLEISFITAISGKAYLN